MNQAGDKTGRLLFICYTTPTVLTDYYHGGPYEIGPTVHTKNYTIRYFYKHYLVLFAMVPGNSSRYQHYGLNMCEKKPLLFSFHGRPMISDTN